jgi:ribosome modulation factor
VLSGVSGDGPYRLSVTFQERWRGRTDAPLHKPVERGAHIFIARFTLFGRKKPRELYSAAGTRSPWLGGWEMTRKRASSLPRLKI